MDQANHQEIYMTFRFPIAVGKASGAGKGIAAACDLLGVEAMGKTEQVAEAALVRAMKKHLEACLAKGTLEQVLREAAEAELLLLERGLAAETRYVEVPLNLMAAQQRMAG